MTAVARDVPHMGYIDTVQRSWRAYAIRPYAMTSM
jgi:hypothetical protein